MSRGAPPGAMGSPYIGSNDEQSSNDISYTELAKRALNIIDKIHPEVKGEDMNAPKVIPAPPGAVTITPNVKPKFLDVTETVSTDKFSQEVKNKLIELLMNNKLLIV